MNTYARTSRIEANTGGVIAGVLATDGEASDGHILNIKGGKLPERAPLLFGHDDWSGMGNLGSWTDFSTYSNGKKLGDSGIRGVAEIELDGSGEGLEKRKDVYHMIERGHIPQFSIRWTEIEEPVRRVNLPSDHPAFVDPKTATGRARWGLYFDSWRLLEGSVVTLGADPAALIGRMQEAEDGGLRQFWRDAVNRSLWEANEASGLVGVAIDDGQVIYVERAAWEAMLEEANRRLSIATDALEDANATLRMAHDVLAANTVRSAEERSEEREEPAETPKEQETPSAPLPDVRPSDIGRWLREGLAQARSEVQEETRGAFEAARGKVSET